MTWGFFVAWMSLFLWVLGWALVVTGTIIGALFLLMLAEERWGEGAMRAIVVACLVLAALLFGTYIETRGHLPAEAPTAEACR